MDKMKILQFENMTLNGASGLVEQTIVV